MSLQGYKTTNRTKIMAFLKEAGDRPVSVSQIKCHMDSINTPVNLTTIYRYLEKLEEEGLLLRYAAGDDGKATYQYVAPDHGCEHHLHLKCVSCGCVEHLDCCFMDEIRRHAAEEHGFSIQCKSSVIYGFCRNCRQ